MSLLLLLVVVFFSKAAERNKKNEFFSFQSPIPHSLSFLLFAQLIP
jgi:hypothetical protein